MKIISRNEDRVFLDIPEDDYCPSQAIVLPGRISIYQENDLITVCPETLKKLLEVHQSMGNQPEPRPVLKRGSINDATPSEWDVVSNKYNNKDQ